MRQRSLAIIVFVLLALVVNAPAFASTGAELEVYHFDTRPGQAEALALYLDVAQSEPATSSATIYVPAGYTLDMSSHAVGANVGAATLKLYAGSTPLSDVNADVVVSDPSLHVGDACAPGLHLAVWLMQFYAGGHNLEIPIYVDGASAELAGKAAYTVRSCIPAPNALGGLRVTTLDLGIDRNVLTTPAAKGVYIWRALVTPYGSDGAPNAAATTEVQTMVPLPQVLKIASRYNAKRGVAVFSGSIMAAGVGRPGILVRLLSSTDSKFTHVSSLGTAQTNAAGRFTLTKALKRTTWIDAFVTPYINDGCDAALGPAPCTLETISAPPDVLTKVTVRRR